jgi:glycosyltransferase involved in cell wall biosynthesis
MAPHPVSLSVVIPAYNEERRLGTTLRQVCGFLAEQPWQWEVRVVDDGSRDGTASIAEEVGRREPRVRVQREPHRGKGGAVKAGLLAAEGQFRFICDADLSMPIPELRRFLPPCLESFDVAIGSREGIAARRIGEPVYRHLMGRLFNIGVRWLTLPGIQDSQCGFKMFTANAVRAIFPHVTVDGWAFDVEVLTIARERGLQIVEVPIEWHYRRESQISMLRDGPAMLGEVLRIRARALRGRYRS